VDLRRLLPRDCQVLSPSNIVCAFSHHTHTLPDSFVELTMSVVSYERSFSAVVVVFVAVNNA
jgi:hypothetical protein